MMRSAQGDRRQKVPGKDEWTSDSSHTRLHLVRHTSFFECRHFRVDLDRSAHKIHP